MLLLCWTKQIIDNSLHPIGVTGKVEDNEEKRPLLLGMMLMLISRLLVPQKSDLLRKDVRVAIVRRLKVVGRGPIPPQHPRKKRIVLRTLLVMFMTLGTRKKCVRFTACTVRTASIW
ncbi:unnamed protein product [Amoebophrya sp. A25]|nr:unnamed protein product [Amoebophrya sp. A25]|eukprot:GSA25T00023328001.1